MRSERQNPILRKRVPLRKGGMIEVLTGLAYEAALRALLEQEPAVFEQLLAIANGQHEGVSPQSVKRLKGCFLLKGNGTIDPDLRCVLLSSYVPDGTAGPQIIRPFKLTLEETRELACAEDQASHNLLGQLRELNRCED